MSSSSQNTFSVTAISTEIFNIGDSLVDFIDRSAPIELRQEGIVLAVTSKIVSFSENRLVEVGVDKERLIREEADYDLGEVSYGCHLTIKNQALLPSAGIDESNIPGGYLLLPEDCFASAQALHSKLKELWRLQNLGIIITDSHTSPLRRGVTGISLGHAGFCGVTDKRNHEDLFGRPLKMTTVNNADALAAAAVWAMGEADEQKPLAILSGADLAWTDKPDEGYFIPIEEDLYYPILKDRLQR